MRGGIIAASRRRSAGGPVIYVTQGSAIQNPTSTSPTVLPRPSGVSIGDFLLVCLGTLEAITYTPPAGWTLIVYRSAGALVPSVTFAYRFADLTSADTYTSPTNANGNGRVLVYQNVDPITPIAAFNSKFSTTASTTHTVTTITVPDGAALIAMAASNGPGGTWNDLAGYTEHLESTGVTPSTNIQSKVNMPAGATGSITLTRSTSIRSAMAIVALNPAA